MSPLGSTARFQTGAYPLPDLLRALRIPTSDCAEILICLLVESLLYFTVGVQLRFGRKPAGDNRVE